MTQAQATEPEPTPAPPRGPGRFARALRRLSLALVVVGAVAALFVVWLIDRPLVAPDWLKTRISAAANAAAPGVEIGFDRLAFTVEQGWRPSLSLRDVHLTGADGREILAVSEMQAALAMRPLLRGEVRPKTATLSGMFATLRRDMDGSLNLVASAQSDVVGRQAGSLIELIDSVDAVFARPDLAAVTNVDVDAVTLRVEDLRSGRVWTVDGARLRAERSGNSLRLAADLALLTGGADVATMEANYTSRIGSTEAEFGINVEDMAARDVADFTPAFDWLGALRAPISGAMRGGVDGDGALTPISATLQIGQGVLQPTSETQPVPFNSARTYFTFDPRAQTLDFAELSVDSAWGRGRADGLATLEGIREGRLDALVGQFRLSALEVDPPDTFTTPVALDGGELDFRLTMTPFRFELGAMRLQDADRAIHVSGALTARPDGWAMGLNAQLEQIEHDRLLALWPPFAAPKLRAWLAENLDTSTFHDLDFVLRAAPETRPDIYLGFGFDNTRLRFLKTMPPIDKGSGIASLAADRFALLMNKGQVTAPQGGVIDVSGSSFVVPDVSVKGGAPAEVDLRTDSTLTAALAILNQPPLRVMQKAGRPVTLGDGRAVLRTSLAFPLRKANGPDEFRYAARGELRALRSDTLVPGRRLAAPVLQVQADNAGVQIGGAGSFDGVPFEATWQRAMGAAAVGAPSFVEGTVELSSDTSQRLGLGLPPWLLSGRGQGQLQLELPQGAPPLFKLESDLRGVSLAIPPVGWAKPAAATGLLRVAGVLGETPDVSELTLQAAGLTARGSVRLRDTGGFDRATFTEVKIDDWLDAPVTLVGREPGTAPAIVVSGGALDLRRSQFGAGESADPAAAGPLSLTLDRLQVTDSIALTGFDGEFGLSGGLQGRFTGAVNGAAPVTGQVEPQGGRAAVRILSEDAGAVFGAAGLLKQGRGGRMELVLDPVGSAGAFNGALSIRNVRVTDAPAMAALFNALSVVGLLEQMGGEGVHFAEVDAAFRLTPDKVTLTEASAVGPSIGLSMDGTFDVNDASMDMQGVFSPIYLINGLGSVFTRRGEGLIGFNFRLTGPAADPRVQVNPLSALTPAIFREIFRRPAPEVSVEPGEEPGQDAPQLLPRQADEDPDGVAPQGGDR